MRKLVFMICEVAFVAVIPAVLITVNYVTWQPEAAAFKISLGGVLLALLVFYLVKKLLINKYLERLKATITQHAADLRVEPDKEKIEALKEALKREKTIECLLNFVIPALLLALLFVVCKSLEAAAVKMSGTVGFIAASEIVGLVFSILSARQVEGRK